MASLTKKTSSIRRRKRSKMGAARKQTLRVQGTTPIFPIHKEVAPAPPVKKKAKAKTKTSAAS